jgi:hypothetical protein
MFWIDQIRNRYSSNPIDEVDSRLLFLFLRSLSIAIDKGIPTDSHWHDYITTIP